MSTKTNKSQTGKRLAVWALIVLQTLPLQSWAATALVTDISAAVKPVLNVSGNGVPIVQIVPPNAGGVSHNKFTQYNVGAEGQILNNSGLGSTSVLAGSVGGNPMLGNSNARLILNEVTSANPSALNGFIEITGKRADLVIANPNGISLDGAGFINASRATLTTGNPQFAGDGNLSGFNIQQGQISVLGNGLDARGADQLQLLSRSLIVNAQLQANWLDIATGANQIDATTGAITPQAGTGTAPAVAVDVGSLGGMYANSIYLVGTETGVGVNTKGKLEALVGDIQLSSAGDLNIVDGQLKAAWDVRADAARDMTVQGSDVQAGGDVALVAGRHLDVNATRNDTATSTVAGATTTTMVTLLWTGSVIEAGGGVTLVANNQTSNGGNLTVSTSAIRANGNALLTGSDVAVESKVDSKLVRNVTYYKKCKWYGSCNSSTTINQSLEETLAGGEVSAAGDITVLALGNRDSEGGLIAETGNLLLLGAAIGSDLGATQLTAVNDLEVEAAQTRHDNSSEVYVKKSGILSTTKTTNIDRSQNLIAEGSLITGEDIQLQSGRDIMVRGGTLSADNDISLVAGRDVDVIEARDFESRDSIRIKKKSGLFGSGLFGITLGTTTTTQITEEDLDTASASQIASIGGGVSILGGSDVLLQGVDILAGTDIDIIGNNVGILAAKNIYDRKDIYKTKTSGLTLALKGGVVSALEAAWQATQRAHGAEDDRLQAAYALKAGYNIYNAVLKDNGAALTHLVEGDILSSATNVGIELSLGTQSSESVNTQHNVTYRASNLDATGDLTVIARAPEAGQTGGVIDIMGSNLKGYNQTLSAGKLLSVRYAPQTYASRETGKSESASVGVGISVGDQNGIYFTAGGQWGNSQGYAYREDNGESYLTAENTLALLSGGDATIKGAIAIANRIEADIVGNLTLTSLQDTDRYTYKNQNVGFGISICVPPICYGTPVNASISASGQNLDHNYQSVVEQTGLFAGEGGFDIQVGGHTQLDGAAIVSSATADKNRLVTQMLDYTDLTNTEKTKVSGYSFGLGTTVASNYYTPTPGVNDNRRSVTQALVSPGVVEIKGVVAQQDVLQSEIGQLESHVTDLSTTLSSLPAAQTAVVETQLSLANYSMGGPAKQPAQLYLETGQTCTMNRGRYTCVDTRVLCTGACATQYTLLKQTLAQQQASLAAYAPIQAQLAEAQASLVLKQAELVKVSTAVSTLQSRTLATANPALANTFNANRTRAQLEAMNVFSETAMRIVGDVYKNDVATSDLKLKAASDKLKAAVPGSAAETTAQTEMATAQAERNVLDSKRAVAHGLVGGLTAAFGGADPVSGAIGATAGKYVTAELSKLIDDSQWAQDNPYAANLLKTLSATAAGSLVGGDLGGFVASQGDRFNRQLHPTEIDWIRKNAALYAALRGNGMTVIQAEAELTQQALKEVDLLWRSVLRDGDNSAAQAFLEAAKGSFLNELNQSQALFSVENNQFLRPDQYLPEAIANMGFYQRNATHYAVRNAADGLRKETKDLAASATRTITDDPVGVAEAIGAALWDAAKHPVNTVVDGVNVGGTTIGEGAAVALSADLTNRLNTLYGQDIATVQKTLVALSTAGAITGSLGAGKLAGAGAKGVKNLSGQAWSALAGEGYRQSRTNYKFTPAEVANGAYPEPAYASARMEFTTGAAEIGYVRVYAEGANNPEGAWFMRTTDIQGLTPLQIQQKYALPTIPSHVVDIAVPPGFRMGVGIAAPNSYARSGGGGVQFQALSEYKNIPGNPTPLQFGTRRPL